MGRYVAIIVRSYQDGYDTTTKHRVVRECSPETTIAELMAWRDRYVNCESCSDIEIVPLDEGGE